jgi:hypothetical protein
MHLQAANRVPAGSRARARETEAADAFGAEAYSHPEKSAYLAWVAHAGL